ncbi:thioredoxin domain-containing protein [Desulfovibrio sp. OttesenSCG-928-A18]|nr:thioredoxin domain-containing protein [Desulfovibrio sp. OttesenSCG-928-A18]
MNVFHCPLPGSGALASSPLRGNIFRSLGCALAALCLVLCMDGQNPAHGAKAADTAMLREQIRQVLRENPELVLDILKENSEFVLEVAQQGNILRKRKAMLAQWEYDAKNPKDPNIEGRAVRGNPAAPVTIVSYSDFTCPYCLAAEKTISQLMQKYQGNVRLVFKPLPKDDPFSQSLAKYSLAAFNLDPEKGWEFFDVLFFEQERFEREGENFLRETATRLGYDFKKLKSEAGSQRVQDQLNEDRKEADGFGISGTPYFLVNDLMVRGAVSKDLFEDAIEKALELKAR